MPESPLDIAILLDDPALIRLVVTWPKIADGKTLEYDSDKLSQAANVPLRELPEVFARAVTHGLIRKDGTMNPYAEKYISTLVARQLYALKPAEKKVK